MFRTEPQEIFLKGTHGVSMQDKKPHARFMVGSPEPQTAAPGPKTASDASQNRQNPHGTENRQTAYIASRVPIPIKTEIIRRATMHNRSESYIVNTLVQKALAQDFGEQFAVMIRNTIRDAVKTELQKDREWLRKINLSNYLASEQARLHAIDLHRLLIPPDEDINQKIKDNREQSYKNLSFYFYSIGIQQEQSPWPLSK
jgi:hypothetical protein